ncbi:hypothetical protein HG531_005016 [Fusarium graminearum]|nr:hypothetical protein HG531_005016 [Fusarium graminearum]
MIARKTFPSYHLNRLVEALIHLGKSVNSRFCSQDLEKLVDSGIPQTTEFSRLRAVGFLVGTQELRDKLGGDVSDRVVEEECKTRKGNLFHNLRDIGCKGSLENLGVDNQEFYSHMFIVHGTRLDTNHLTLKGNKLPTFLVLHLLDLVIVIQQLNISLGYGKFK